MNYELDYWMNDTTRTFMSRDYLRPEQSIEDRITEICQAAAKILKKPEFAGELEYILRRGWVSLSTPVWANFGTTRGLPISCNNSYFEDNVQSILLKTAEIGMQTKNGAGTSAYLGHIRPRGSKISTGGFTDGPVHFMGMIQETTDIISQSSVRRGACAPYLDAEHPDFLEFLECREEGNHIQHLSLGACVSDAFLEKVKQREKREVEIWLRLHKKRFESGYPYIFFSDTVNRNKPQVYKDKGYTIWSSNLCSEICLPSSPDESFVCNLASMNILHFDEWKDTNAVSILAQLLDAVMTEYIEKTEGNFLMETARSFAMNHRAIGIGWLGWHSYLQANNIPFESMDAKLANVRVAQTIEKQALAASRYMAEEYGEPKLLEGYGMRNTTLQAIAPTVSSSIILGQVSPSIEPENSNYYTKDSAKGKFTHRNPFLQKLLQQKGKDVEKVWDEILLNGGSVQKLDFLDAEEKAVFKTFGEISQKEIIIQAAQRQKHIDQSQSLNLMIHPDTPIKDVNALIFDAHALGVKTLYYQRSVNLAQEYSRELVSCQSCEA